MPACFSTAKAMIGPGSHKLRKIDEMKGKGVLAYAYSFKKTHSAQDLCDQYRHVLIGKDEENGEIVQFAGRIMMKRLFGKLAFLSAQDDSGRIQLYVDKKCIGEEAFQRMKDWVDTGDIVGVTGKIKRTDRGELSINVTEWYMLTKAMTVLPDKYHGLVDVETRYRHRHLDMVMNPHVRKVFHTRSAVIRRIRRFLDAKGFLEMETPVLIACAGGADAAPFVTHHNALDMRLSLRIATELHLKRLVVGGLDRVYEIGKIFRNEGLSTRHNPEFTSVELYQAYADYIDMMEMVEDIFREVLHHCNDLCHDPLIVSYQGTEIDMSFPWRRVSMDGIVQEVTGIDFKEIYSSKDLAAAKSSAEAVGVPINILDSINSIGEALNAVFEHSCEKTIVNPTFVTDHPVEISPLARTHRSRGDAFTERFELFILGREYANAFSELTDPIEQRRRFKMQVNGRQGRGRFIFS